MEWSTWLGFFAASWVISVSPGPGAIYAMSCGINHGFRRGYVGSIGMIAGMCTALAIVAVGLGAVLLASAHAFTILKWCGVFYLVYLGVKQWRAPAQPFAATQPKSAEDSSVRSLLIRGWAVNATNPKGYVFMLAVMPQFVNTEAPMLFQYFIIALTLAFTDLVVMAGYTALASKVLTLFRTPVQMRWLHRSFGGMFVAAAVALATFKRAN